MCGTGNSTSYEYNMSVNLKQVCLEAKLLMTCEQSNVQEEIVIKYTKCILQCARQLIIQKCIINCLYVDPDIFNVWRKITFPLV